MKVGRRIQPVLNWGSTGCSFNDVADYLLYNNPEIHDYLFAGAKGVNSIDADGFQQVSYLTKEDLKYRWIQGRNRPGEQWRPLMHPQSNRDICELLEAPEQLWRISITEREILWAHWEKAVLDLKCDELQSCMEEFAEASHQLQVQYKEADKRCLEVAHVIGVTTTGLAMNAELLRGLPAKVLICEEAAGM